MKYKVTITETRKIDYIVEAQTRHAAKNAVTDCEIDCVITAESFRGLPLRNSPADWEIIGIRA